MKIAICGSLDFSHKMGEIAEELRKEGHEVIVPLTSEAILRGEITLEKIKDMKRTGDIVTRAVEHDVIKKYYNKIKESDAVLIVNMEKKGVPGYIGGNTFLELGFAFVLEKTIFLYNDIPDMDYTDEIKIMQPVILDGDLDKIK